MMRSQALPRYKPVQQTSTLMIAATALAKNNTSIACDNTQGQAMK